MGVGQRRRDRRVPKDPLTLQSSSGYSAGSTRLEWLSWELSNWDRGERHQGTLWELGRLTTEEPGMESLGRPGGVGLGWTVVNQQLCAELLLRGPVDEHVTWGQEPWEALVDVGAWRADSPGWATCSLLRFTLRKKP